jgi:hypothetical protein
MGLFGKLKANMNHGGVKVHVQAPSSIPGNQVIPVQVTITADSSQTIDSVKAEIKAQAKEQGISMSSNSGGMENSRTTHQTVAEVESREPFTLGPGESKTINLELYINGSAGSVNPLAQFNNAGGALGSVLQSVASVAQNFEHINYIYSVHASANVQGITLDPNDKQPIQILPPTQAAQAAQTVQAVQPTQPSSPVQNTTQQQITQPVPLTPGMPQPVQPTQNVGSNPNQIP